MSNISNINLSLISCEICKHLDNFNICKNCFNNYKEKTVNYRKSLQSSKQTIRNVIQDIVTKNYSSLSLNNKNILRSLNYQNNLKKIKAYGNKISKLENFKLNIKQSIVEKRKNIEYLKLTLNDKANDHLNNFKCNKCIPEALTELNKIKDEYKDILNDFKKFFFTFASSFLIDNTFSIEEFFKKQDNLEIINKNNFSLKNEDQIFIKLPNILSSDKDLKYNNKNIKSELISENTEIANIKIKKYIDINKIYNLNTYIYSLMYFTGYLSRISLQTVPFHYNLNFYTVITNGEEHNIMKFFFNYEHSDNNNYLETVLECYKLIDKNLKFIKQIFGYQGTEDNTIKHFLRIEKSKFNEKQNSNLITLERTENNTLNNNQIYDILNNYTPNIQTDDDFVVIDNFY